MSLVVDASVLAKLFVTEGDSDRALVLVSTHTVVMAPSLAAVEVASAVARRFRVGGITRAGAEAALAQARRFFTGVSIALFDDAPLLARAEELALDLKQALKDCLYVALAERVSADLVTADMTLLARAQPHFPFVKPL